MPPPIVAGVLTLTDKTAGTLRRIGGKITGTMADIAKTAAGFLVRDLSRAMVSVGQEAIKLGAQAETLQTSFDRLKGTGVDQSLEQLSAAVNGTVSDIDLLTAANQAMALGLPTEKLDELFAAAQKVGAAMGRTTLQAVQDLTTGMGRQSRLILDNLGIIVDTEKAHEDFAKAIGKTVSELTDEEKKTAFVNAAMKQLNKTAKILGDNVSDTQQASEQFTATIKNLKTEIGTFLIPIVTELSKTFLNDFLPSITAIVDLFKSRDFEAIGQIIMDTFQNAMNRVTDFLDSIDWQGIWVMASDVAANVFTDISTRVMDIINGIDWQEAWDSLVTYAGTLWSLVKDKLIDWGTRFKDDVIPKEGDWPGIFDSLKTFAGTLWSTVMSPAIQEIVPVLKSWLPSTTEDWAEAWLSLWDFGKELWTLLLDATGDIAQDFSDFVNETDWEPLEKAFRDTIGVALIDAMFWAWDQIFKVLQPIDFIAQATKDLLAGADIGTDIETNPFSPEFIGPPPFLQEIVPRVEPTAGGGSSRTEFHIHVGTFIGTDEEAALKLIKIIGAAIPLELERRGIQF